MIKILRFPGNIIIHFMIGKFSLQIMAGNNEKLLVYKNNLETGGKFVANVEEKIKEQLL